MQPVVKKLVKIIISSIVVSKVTITKASSTQFTTILNLDNLMSGGFVKMLSLVRQ